jgi:hypothetical protein
MSCVNSHIVGRLSQTAAADMRQRITTGEWAVDPLPSVGDLAVHY